MKVLKKFAGMILAICLMVPMIGTVAFAAEGRLMFSDPSAKVGDNVEVDLVVQSNSGETVGDVEVNMTYDPAALEFVSGEGFAADGSGACGDVCFRALRLQCGTDAPACRKRSL